MVRETLYGVLVMSLLGGLALQIFPADSRVQPYVRFLLALAVPLMLLSPLIGALPTALATDPMTAVTDGKTTDGYSQYWDDAVSNMAQTQAASELAALISAETGIGVHEMRVALTTDTYRTEQETTVTVTGVSVTLLRREHRIAAEKIEALTEKTMLCPCTVAVSEEEDA